MPWRRAISQRQPLAQLRPPPAARDVAHRDGDGLLLPDQNDGCRRALCWNSMWRNLPRHEAIGLGGEVNWLIDGPCGERLPAIDLAHVDLTGGEQGPEQHGGSLC